MGFTAVVVEDDAADTEASAVIAIPKKAAAPPPAKKSSKGSRKAQRSGSNASGLFSDKQLAEFKEIFKFIDEDKDGIISRGDLHATYNTVGSRAPDEDSLNEMLGEGSGPINFTTILNLFASKMTGPADDDEVIINAFKTFDRNGTIDSESLRLQLMSFGDKFTEEEIDNVFDNLDVDNNGRFETGQLIQLVVGKGDGEEEEGEGQAEPEPDEEVTFSL